jgi:transcriptional regulator GlxA family with amidase domain
LNLFDALKQESPVLHAQTCLYDFVAASVLMPKSERKVQGSSESLKRVKEKLLDEISGEHELESLAQEVGMSRYQLLRAFKNHYGLPPYAYLMDEKIKRAKSMLRSGLALADIAHTLGFSDQAHFQRQFKKRLAVTPKYYQSHFV